MTIAQSLPAGNQVRKTPTPGEWDRGVTQPVAAVKPTHVPSATPSKQESPALSEPLGTFEAFFARYEQSVFGYIYRMTGDEQTAHDLCQEAFLRAWQHFDKIQGYTYPSAWLFRVAANLALSHLRRRASPVGGARLLGDDDSPARSDPAMRFVESDLVTQTLLGLSQKQRSALVLREIYGLSCEEVGQMLGMSREAVKMSLWRAREQFRRRYTLAGES
ncbi:MAG: RNA polymerase sigma factor [Ktedonobacterales bacterium]